MKKIVRLSEDELVGMVNNIVKEQQEKRIIRGGMINNNIDFQRFESKGVKPYYLDTETDGDYKMVEITSPPHSSKQFVRVFLLKPIEFEKINKIIGGINNLTSLYLQKIELFKQYIPSVLVDKIMED